MALIITPAWLREMGDYGIKAFFYFIGAAAVGHFMCAWGSIYPDIDQCRTFRLNGRTLPGSRMVKKMPLFYLWVIFLGALFLLGVREVLLQVGLALSSITVLVRFVTRDTHRNFMTHSLRGMIFITCLYMLLLVPAALGQDVMAELAAWWRGDAAAAAKFWVIMHMLMWYFAIPFSIGWADHILLDITERLGKPVKNGYLAICRNHPITKGRARLLLWGTRATVWVLCILLATWFIRTAQVLQEHWKLVIEAGTIENAKPNVKKFIELLEDTVPEKWQILAKYRGSFLNFMNDAA